MSSGSRGPDAPDQRQDQVLGRNAGGAYPCEVRFEIARLRQHETLRREHVFDFAGAKPQREGTEGAVCRRMRIAAHDQHARLRRAELGRDHVHDALIR